MAFHACVIMYFTHICPFPYPLLYLSRTPILPLLLSYLYLFYLDFMYERKGVLLYVA